MPARPAEAIIAYMQEIGVSRAERVARGFRALNRQEPGPLLELLDPQVILIDTQAGNPVGSAAVASHLSYLARALPDLRCELEDLLEAGARLVVRAVLHGTHLGILGRHQPTGRLVRLPVCAVSEWEGDRVSTVQLYWDRLVMLEQLGLTW